MNTKKSAGGYDWKKYPKGWKYKHIEDSKYIEDRDNMLKEHGNGWYRLLVYRATATKGRKK